MINKLPTSWCFWENRVNVNSKPQGAQFQSAVKRMFTISSLEELAAYWKHPDSHVASLLNFFDCQGIKRHSLEGETVCSNTISLFRQGVQPLWEDPKNSVGGDHFTCIKLLEKDWDALYESIVFSLLANNPEFLGKVLGVRFHYNKKLSTDMLLAIKVEFWFGFNSTAKVEVQCLADQLKALLDSFHAEHEPLKFRDHLL